ncbi:MAG: MarR family transcriptional regulator [Desulfobacterales bacterium]|nr:MarR family transcriptional regulator [Desulfobacterales bacterium]
MTHLTARATSFGYRFAMIHRIDRALAHEGLKTFGLTQAQIPFLMELLHQDTPMTQQELSQTLVIDPAATARTLEQLEKNGWIHRKVNPKNRRQKLVFPSQKAREHEDKLIFVLKEASQSLVSDFSEKEKRTVLTFLDRIMANGLEAKGGIKE